MASRGKVLVQLALKKIKEPPTDQESVNSKVCGWLKSNVINEAELNLEDFSSDYDCRDPEYIPESDLENGSSSRSCDTTSKSIIIKNQDSCVSQGIGDGRHKSTDEGPESVSQANRSAKPLKKKPKRLCKYCDTWNVHLTRHIKRMHKNEEEVALALKLPLKDQERVFAGFKKAGIFKANMANRALDKNAPLIRERSQGKAETVMCTGCRGFYDAKNIFKHKRFCQKNVSELSNTAKMHELSDSATIADVDNDFKENILDRFRKNDVGEICRTDLLTILFGKKQWAKSVKKERSVTMSEMRVLANLILSFRRESGDEKASGCDMLNYRQFNYLEKSIKAICSKEDGDDKAGLKVRIGFVLKRAVKVMRGYYIINEEFQKEADMSRFVDVLDLHWDFIFFTAQVECEQRRGGLRKPLAMPEEEDIILLRNFILKQIENVTGQYELWDKHTFVNTRNLLVARLTLFNARRGGEPARLTLQEWKEAITGCWMDPNLVQQIDDPMEKCLIEKLKLAYQSGKGSRKMVPVLIPEDTVEPITKLVQERKNCRVSENNVFLFPNTSDSLDHASGYHCLKSIVDSCPNLKKPHLLIADKFRHRVSTIFAQLDLPEEERNLFYSHMAHSEAINKNVYQCPLAVKEVTQVGKFLLHSVDNRSNAYTNIARTSGHNIRTQSHDAEENKNVDNEIPVGLPHQDDLGCTDHFIESVNSGTKKGERRYTKWNANESALVKLHFKEYITDTTNKGILPGKLEVSHFLDSFHVLEGHKNKVKLIKTKVFNEKKKYRNGKFDKV